VYYVPLDAIQKPVELSRTKQAVPARIAVSRDGKSLAFTRMVNISQIWITAAGGGEARPLFQDSVVRARVPIFFAGWNEDDLFRCRLTMRIWVSG